MAVDDPRQGTTVRILSAATGGERGRVEIAGDFLSAVYREGPGLLFVTTSEDDVYAVDPETGETKWEASAASVGPATAETVYLYGGSTVWAVRTADGTREWTTVLPDAVSDVCSPDRLEDGTLRFTVGDHRETSLVGIDAGSGTERFHHQSPDVKEYLVDGRTILALVEKEYQVQRIVRVDGRTGGEQWSHTLAEAGNVDDDTVEIRDDAIYVAKGENEGITVLDPVTGRVSEALEGYRGLFSDASTLYSAKASAGGTELHAIDPETQRVAWRTPVDTELTGIAFDSEDGDVYLSERDSDESGVVYRLNGATGRIRWECPVAETVDTMLVDASPLLAHSSLHPMMADMFSEDDSADQSVYAIDKQRGRAEWSFSVESANVSAATDGYVAVPSDGVCYVLDRDDGRIELELDGEYDIADEALFAVTGTTLSAYPLSDAPAAFSAGSGSTGNEGATAVYDRSEASGGEAEETGVSDQNGGDANGRGSDTRVFADSDAPSPSFCPGCGTDLESHADASFCPDCGTSLTE